MSQKYNHLFHLENTQENRDLIKFFNKNMKEHNSKWKFRIKYRKPKEGHKYGSGGTLKRENAREFAVYMNGGYTRDEMNKVRENLGLRLGRIMRTRKELEVVEDYVDSCFSNIYNQIQQVKELLK